MADIGKGAGGPHNPAAVGLPASLGKNLGFDPWASGVLNPSDHARLVAGIDAVSRRAGLGERYKYLIAEKTTEGLLNPMELDWLRSVVVYARTGSWEFGRLGFAYGPSDPNIYDRMRQMVARLLRNIVDARMLSLSEILAERKANDGVVEGTCILCPDFMLPEYAAALSDWDRREMLGFLKDRVKSGKPTTLALGGSMLQLSVGGKFPSILSEIANNFKTAPSTGVTAYQAHLEELHTKAQKAKTPGGNAAAYPDIEIEGY